MEAIDEININFDFKSAQRTNQRVHINTQQPRSKPREQTETFLTEPIRMIYRNEREGGGKVRGSGRSR